MKSKIIFGTLVIATTTWLVVGMAESASATDCKYIQKIVLDDNNIILSAKTEYVCKESKPIVVLPPKTFNEVKRVVPKAVSYQDYVNGNFYNNEKGLDFLLKLLYTDK